MTDEFSPLVSAVIPTRGRSQLLCRAVLSALNQTEQRVEVIVVIDGQDEDTEAALDLISDDRLVRVCLRESVGGAEARNIGVRAAGGQWIALLDDDDEWLPEKLARQLQMANLSGSEQIVVTSKYVVRHTGRTDVIRPRRLPKPDEPVAEYMFDYLCYFQTSTFFCSRKLMLDVPFRRDLRSFQDIDWFLRAMTTPGVSLAVVPEPLAIYYAPEERATITNGLSWEERLAWGRANRDRMTRRAYSRFIAGSCVGRAAQDKAGLPGLFTLLRECVLHGRPTPSNVAFIIGMFLVTPSMRQSIRDIFFLPAYKASHP